MQKIDFKSQNSVIFNNFYASLFKALKISLGSSLAFDLKGGPVKCAKVCDKSWVILKNLSQVQSQMHIAFLEGQLLPVTQSSYPFNLFSYLNISTQDTLQCISLSFKVESEFSDCAPTYLLDTVQNWNYRQQIKQSTIRT